MNYKLTVYPALEVSRTITQFVFDTPQEMLAAKNTAADLLLFIQDRMSGVMEPYSNVFVMEEFVDGEWLEFDEDDYC